MLVNTLDYKSTVYMQKVLNYEIINNSICYAYRILFCANLRSLAFDWCKELLDNCLTTVMLLILFL